MTTIGPNSGFDASELLARVRQGLIDALLKPGQSAGGKTPASTLNTAVPLKAETTNSPFQQPGRDRLTAALIDARIIGDTSGAIQLRPDVASLATQRMFENNSPGDSTSPRSDAPINASNLQQPLPNPTLATARPEALSLLAWLATRREPIAEYQSNPTGALEVRGHARNASAPQSAARLMKIGRTTVIAVAVSAAVWLIFG